jgi:hypothetical protein
MVTNKKAIAMSFNWLFALITGAVILFLAIYATANIIGTGEEKIYTETAARLTSLLDPMSTGLASEKSTSINFKKETKTYYECDSRGVFGTNRVAFSEKTLGEQFGEKGGYINTKKYVFAEDIIQGKELNLFSKPFFMPFKIDDVIVIFGKDYCFYMAPEEIKEEISRMGMKKIHFSDDLKNCTGEKVCFGYASGCDIEVYGICSGYSCKSPYDSGRVMKDGKTMYYTGSLLYGAIFSSPKIYECNVKRIIRRFEELNSVYTDKIRLMEIKGCSSNIGADLMSMSTMTSSLNSSESLFVISETAKIVDAKNMAAICRVY